MSNMKWNVLFLSSIMLSSVTNAASFNADNISQLKKQLSAASSGDVFVLKNGTYNNTSIFLNKKGITLRAENPGEVIFTGTTSISIADDNITVSGFVFQNAQNDSSKAIVEFNESSNSTFTNSAFYRSGSHKWKHQVKISKGNNNTISHNYFEDIRGQGIGVNTTGSVGNKIIYNHLNGTTNDGDRNGQEPIQLGQSIDRSYNNPNFKSETYVEHNLIENMCGDADPELISSKSNGNIIRYNSIINNCDNWSIREIVVRGGIGTTVSNNYIDDNSGIRYQGPEHIIKDNNVQKNKVRSRPSGNNKYKTGASVSNNNRNNSTGPLTKNDVGPFWLYNDSTVQNSNNLENLTDSFITATSNPQSSNESRSVGGSENQQTSNNIFIATNGIDGATGSQDNPTKSISNAVAGAQPGDEILLKAGTYVLTDTEIIEAEGTNSNRIIIKPEQIGDNVIIDASAVPAHSPALKISGKYVELRGINLINATGTGISVDAQSVILAQNVIMNAGGIGIHVKSEGKVRLTSNEITGTVDVDNDNSAGILVENAENIVIENSLVHKNKTPGILINNAVQAKLKSNQINDNDKANINIDNVDSADIEYNHIFATDNKDVIGVMFNNIENATIVNNYLYNISTAFANSGNITAASASNNIIEHNTVLNTSIAAFNFAPMRSGSNNILLDSNILETKGHSYDATGSDLRAVSFENNCFSDTAPMPSEALGNNNVSVELSLINASLGIEDPKNLTSADNICRTMEAGVEGFQPIQLEPSNISAERGINNVTTINPTPVQIDPLVAPVEPVTFEEAETANEPVLSQNTEVNYGEAAGQDDNETSMVLLIRNMVTSIVTAILNMLFGLERT